MQASQRITRKSASNLALAFVLLPREKRDSMTVLYAFCREVDDVADEEGLPVEERRRRLAAWKMDVQAACANGQPQIPVVRELQPVIQRYRLPWALFEELLRGVEMDLDIHRYAAYEQLDQYCYRVASVVGLLSLEIFGYQNPACRDYALHLGRALQLTNILRDVASDAARDRIYLPQSELARFGVTEDAILRHEFSPAYRALAASVAERARNFYRLARQSLPDEDRRSMIAAELMGAVYWRLLQLLERQDYNVFGPHRIRLHRGQKLFLIARTWYRLQRHRATPNYGYP